MTDKPNSPPLDKEDESFFESYLQGDSPLSEIYQQSQIPAPSEQLDQTILAAAQQQAGRHHWWGKPGSWVATIAIVSLVALLAHNTWKTEQEYLQQEQDSQGFRDSSPEAELHRAPFATTEPLQKEAEQLSKQAGPTWSRNTSKDARKPQYKIAPAPVLTIPSEQRLSEPAERLSRKESKDAVESPLPGKARPSLQGATLSETITADSVAKKQEGLAPADSEAQQWLEQIRQLLSNQQTEKARQLYRQLRKKYPDYPVDPVIVQQLSPY